MPEPMGGHMDTELSDDRGWRCVVTGIEPDGREVVRADQLLALDAVGPGLRMGGVLAIDGHRASVDDGEPGTPLGDARPGSFGVDALVGTGPDSWIIGPTLHRPSTVEAYVVVAGDIVVELDGPAVTLGPGDVFLPRDQAHRIRSASAVVRLLAVHFHLDPTSTDAVQTEVRSESGPAKRVRRVVAGTDATGAATFIHDGDPAIIFTLGERDAPLVALADVWEIGGTPKVVAQGGDPPEPFELEPRAFGAKVLSCELKPVVPTSDPSEGWHITATIDVDVLVQGNVDLHLPDTPPISLQAGDIVVQRGTNHRWVATGEQQMKMISIMVGVESATGRSAGH